MSRMTGRGRRIVVNPAPIDGAVVLIALGATGLGTRLWDGRGPWDYNTDFIYQFGRFGPGAISAWSVASDTGYAWRKAPWQPRFGFKADIATGNQNPNGKNRADGARGDYS